MATVDRAAVDLLTAGRAEALFCSALAVGSHPNRAELDAAIRTAVRSHGGTRGCAADVAYAFGDHPDTAVQRMLWARATVAQGYARSPR